MKIVYVLSIIFVSLCLEFDWAQSQAYGGALSYKILFQNNDYVKMKLLSHLTIKGTTADTDKCSSKCGELVDSQKLLITTIDKFDYLNTTANANQTSIASINPSFYCNSGYPTGPATNTLFISGKKEFDVVLPITKTKTIDMKYKGGFLNAGQDYLDAYFRLRVNLNNREGQSKPNTPPNLEGAEIFKTFIADENNTYALIVKDDDNDAVKCEFLLNQTLCDAQATCKDIHSKFKLQDCVLFLQKDSYNAATTDPLVLDILVSDYDNKGNLLSSVPYFISINIVKSKTNVLNATICNSKGTVEQLNPFNIKEVSGSSVLKSFTFLNILFVIISIIYNNY